MYVFEFIFYFYDFILFKIHLMRLTVARWPAAATADRSKDTVAVVVCFERIPVFSRWILSEKKLHKKYETKKISATDAFYI